MRVNHVDDHISHAVIGNQESVEMGVSDGAALMHILSTGLYTYPKLAVIRETLCNAWDAHISAGITDKPISVTLSEQQLIIRDYGHGIPHDKIGEIYGVYGNSTKRDDSTTTGGFGLGSKSPFAYTDTFDVTSHCNGTKTLYNISKSSLEVGGKPSINKILSLPTQESGIEIKINIHDNSLDSFRNAIIEVVTLGELLVSINGAEPIKTIPTSQSKSGYIICNYAGTNITMVNIRYGNVVYPLPRHEEYGENYDRILHGLKGLWLHPSIIFMAEPNSISIAPSREALILTNKTVATVKGLLNKITIGNDRVKQKTLEQISHRQVNEALKKQNFCFNFFTKEVAIDGDQRISNNSTYTTQFRKAQILSAMAKNRSINRDDVTKKRISVLSKAGRINKSLATKLIKAAIKDEQYSNISRYTQGIKTTHVAAEIHKHITYPIREAISKSELLNRNSLSFCLVTRWGHNSIEDTNSINTDMSAHILGLVFKDALLARSKKDLNTWLNLNKRGNANPRVVLITGRKTGAYEEAEAILTKLGYSITEAPPEVKQKKENSHGNRTANIKSASPKRVGYLTLSSSYSTQNRTFRLSTARANADPKGGLTSPIAWVVLDGSGDFSAKRFCLFSSEEARIINKLFGDKIAVVTRVQANKLEEKGVPDVSDYVSKYVDDKLADSAEYKNHLSFAGSEEIAGDDNEELISSLVTHKKLMKQLKLPFSVSPETQVLTHFLKTYSYRYPKKFPKLHLLRSTVTVSPKLAEVSKAISSSGWLRYLDVNELTSVLDSAVPESEETVIPYEIVRKLLK